MRREPSPFRAVVFDLDGVLVDSEIWWDEERIAFATRRGLGWTLEDRAACQGQNTAGWTRATRERLGLDEPLEAIEREIVEALVARYRAEGPPLIDGAVEVVRRLHGQLPLAVASSAHRAVIDAALGSVGIAELFDVIVSSDEVAHGKPDPAVYLEAARRLGVPPGTCLVAEDSLNGVLAARAAGMTVLLVPNEAVPPAPGAHEAATHVADSIAALLSLSGVGEG